MVGRFTCTQCTQAIRIDYDKAPAGDFVIACPKCRQQYQLTQPEADSVVPLLPVPLKPVKLRSLRCPSCGRSFQFDVLSQDSQHPKAECTHCQHTFSLSPWSQSNRWGGMDSSDRPLFKTIFENRAITGLLAILMAYVYGVQYAVEDYSAFWDGLMFLFFTLGVYWVLGVSKLHLSRKFFLGYSTLFTVVWLLRLAGYNRLASPVLDVISELYMMGFLFFNLLEFFQNSFGFIPLPWYRRLFKLDVRLVILANLLLCIGMIWWKIA